MIYSDAVIAAIYEIAEAAAWGSLAVVVILAFALLLGRVALVFWWSR